MTVQEKTTLLVKELGINPIYARRLAKELGHEDFLARASAQLSQKAKPFVKWVGGKRQLLKQFQNLGLYPPEGFDPTQNTYYEPFAGGGAVFFDLLPAKAVLSDMNHELVATYQVIRDDVDRLVSSLKKHIYDKEYFLKVRAQDPADLDVIEVASRFIFLNRTGFNGMYRVNSKGQFNVPFGKYANPKICDEENLRAVSKMLKNVDIYHQDYKKVLDVAQPGDFVYFDPPYYPVSKTASFTSYVKDAFLEKEQEELRDAFVELHNRGCFVMLSNSDTPFINEIYAHIPGVTIHTVQAGRAINSKASKRGKVSEVLVVNY